jgi:hypothetical protein
MALKGMPSAKARPPGKEVPSARAGADSSLELLLSIRRKWTKTER